MMINVEGVVLDSAGFCSLRVSEPWSVPYRISVLDASYFLDARIPVVDQLVRHYEQGIGSSKPAG